jgi:hypothetical protein
MVPFPVFDMSANWGLPTIRTLLPSGPLMPTARAPNRSVSAALHVAGKKVYLPRRNVPASEWHSAGAHVDSSNIVPPESETLTPQSLSTGDNDTGGFLSRLRARCPNGQTHAWRLRPRELETLGISVQGVIPHQKGRRENDVEKDRPPDILSSRWLEAPRFVKGSLANRGVGLGNNRGDVCRT